MAAVGPLGIVIATATADRWSTFAILLAGEGLAFAGVPAVGAASIGAAGVLASQGTIHLWAVIVVGTIGAELGGMVGWHIGFRVARAGSDRPGRFPEKRTKALAGGERFAARWGPLMVLFVPAYVSGGMGMEFGRFARWNLLSSFLWVLVAGLGAYGIGSAAGGGSLTAALVPIVIAVAALAGAALLLYRWRARRHARATAA